MKKSFLLFLLVLALISVMTGCGENNRTNDKSPASDISSYIGDITSNNSGNNSMENNSQGNNSMGNGSVGNDSLSNGSIDDGNITKDRAKEIAIQHAGLKADDIRDLEIDIDRENGIEYYDIDFEFGNKDYEYHINTKTGEIIHSKAEDDI